MNESLVAFRREVLKRTVADLCRRAGWEGVTTRVMEVLVELLEKYLLKLSCTTKAFSELYNRQKPNLTDMWLSYKQNGVDLSDLLEYLENFEEDPSISYQVPTFPAPRSCMQNEEKISIKHKHNKHKTDLATSNSISSTSVALECKSGTDVQRLVQREKPQKAKSSSYHMKSILGLDSRVVDADLPSMTANASRRTFQHHLSSHPPRQFPSSQYPSSNYSPSQYPPTHHQFPSVVPPSAPHHRHSLATANHHYADSSTSHKAQGYKKQNQRYSDEEGYGEGAYGLDNTLPVVKKQEGMEDRKRKYRRKLQKEDGSGREKVGKHSKTSSNGNSAGKIGRPSAAPQPSTTPTATLIANLKKTRKATIKEAFLAKKRLNNPITPLDPYVDENYNGRNKNSSRCDPKSAVVEDKYGQREYDYKEAPIKKRPGRKPKKKGVIKSHKNNSFNNAYNTYNTNVNLRDNSKDFHTSLPVNPYQNKVVGEGVDETGQAPQAWSNRDQSPSNNNNNNSYTINDSNNNNHSNNNLIDSKKDDSFGEGTNEEILPWTDAENSPDKNHEDVFNNTYLHNNTSQNNNSHDNTSHNSHSHNNNSHNNNSHNNKTYNNNSYAQNAPHNSNNPFNSSDGSFVNVCDKSNTSINNYNSVDNAHDAYEDNANNIIESRERDELYNKDACSVSDVSKVTGLELILGSKQASVDETSSHFNTTSHTQVGAARGSKRKGVKKSKKQKKEARESRRLNNNNNNNFDKNNNINNSNFNNNNNNSYNNKYDENKDNNSNYGSNNNNKNNEYGEYKDNNYASNNNNSFKDIKNNNNYVHDSTFNNDPINTQRGASSIAKSYDGGSSRGKGGGRGGSGRVEEKRDEIEVSMSSEFNAGDDNLSTLVSVAVDQREKIHDLSVSRYDPAPLYDSSMQPPNTPFNNNANNNHCSFPSVNLSGDAYSQKKKKKKSKKRKHDVDVAEDELPKKPKMQEEQQSLPKLTLKFGGNTVCGGKAAKKDAPATHSNKPKAPIKLVIKPFSGMRHRPPSTTHPSPPHHSGSSMMPSSRSQSPDDLARLAVGQRKSRLDIYDSDQSAKPRSPIYSDSPSPPRSTPHKNLLHTSLNNLPYTPIPSMQTSLKKSRPFTNKTLTSTPQSLPGRPLRQGKGAVVKGKRLEKAGKITQPNGEVIWICPTCRFPDNGSPMIGCDKCDDWYHWVCVNITEEPPEEVSWFCTSCISQASATKNSSKRGRPPIKTKK